MTVTALARNREKLEALTIKIGRSSFLLPMTSKQASEQILYKDRKLTPSIFIGRWTAKILFSLKQRPYRHG
jgi:hypothetical protein